MNEKNKPSRDKNNNSKTIEGNKPFIQAGLKTRLGNTPNKMKIIDRALEKYDELIRHHEERFPGSTKARIDFSTKIMEAMNAKEIDLIASSVETLWQQLTQLEWDAPDPNMSLAERLAQRGRSREQ